MAAYLLDLIPVRQTDDNGDPVPGARLYTYEAGTSTPLPTYTDATGVTPLANPIVADGDGYWPEIWVLPQAYKLVAQEPDATPLWQRDNVLAPLGAVAADTGADRIGFIQVGTGAVPRDMLAKARETVSAQDFGALGDGSTDDTVALNNAMAAAAAAGYTLRLLPGLTYRFSQLTLAANLTLLAAGAALRSDGSLTGSAVTVTVGTGCRVDSLLISTPGTETNTDIMSLGTNVQFGSLTVLSDAQRAGGGITCTGQDVHIDVLRTSKIDRPIHFYNQSTTTQTTGGYIGYLDIQGYVRGFRADFCSFRLGKLYMRGRSANASKTNGHNGVLIQGCEDWSVGDWWIEDPGEHAFRIGGSPGAYCESANFQVGNGVAIRTGGCALKINPSFETAPGVTEKCSNFSFGFILGIDIGDTTLGGNEELLRLSHAQHGYIAGAYAITEDAAESAQYALLGNDLDDITIGELGGDAIGAGFVSLDSTSDADGVTQFAGDVTNLRIGRIVGTCGGGNALTVAMNAFNVSQVHIDDMDVTGFTSNFYNHASGTLSGVFEVNGRVRGGTVPNIAGNPGSNLILDIRYLNTRSLGRGDQVRWTAGAFQVTTQGFDPSNLLPKSLFLNSGEGTAAAGAYGGALEASRVGSTRRGGAIAIVQTGAAQENTGWEMSVGNVTTASDSVLSAMRLTHERALQIVDGITAPATVTGWSSIYVDTADGDLKIKFGDGTVKTIVTDT